MPNLNLLVGNGWANGTLAVHQEHLYSETIRTLLLVAIERIQPQSGKPKVLLSTPPDERHDLGLLMVHSVLALTGAHCISLGPETPATELAAAALSQQARVVALSFSIGFPSRRILPFLAQVRKELPDRIEVWAGGAGVDRRRRMLSGIRTFPSLEAAAAEMPDCQAGRGGLS